MLTAFKSAFEAVERPWLGAAFAFLAVAINVPLNFALIWGIGPFPQLGPTGAGVASLLAEALAQLAEGKPPLEADNVLSVSEREVHPRMQRAGIEALANHRWQLPRFRLANAA